MALINAAPIDEIGRTHPAPALHADAAHAHGSAVSWARFLQVPLDARYEAVQSPT